MRYHQSQKKIKQVQRQKKIEKSSHLTKGKTSLPPSSSDVDPFIQDSWVSDIRFLPVAVANDFNENVFVSISVISWNILAQTYCSRKSQTRLPPDYQHVVFNPVKRTRCMEQILRLLSTTTSRIVEGEDLSNGENQDESTELVDVWCLQEVDLDLVAATLREYGYVGVETPRSPAGGGIGSRVDACAVYVNQAAWTIVAHEFIRLDDLATLSSLSPASTPAKATSADEQTSQKLDSTVEQPSNVDNNSNRSSSAATTISMTHWQGIQQSFLRRNVALLVRIQHVETGQTVVVANAHLYWHPGFEYVKLCQAHYLACRARQFQSHDDEPVILCGDLNSRPGGHTHTYLSRGVLNAKTVAPWYAINDGDDISEDEEDEDDVREDLNPPTNEIAKAAENIPEAFSTVSGEEDSSKIAKAASEWMTHLNLSDNPEQEHERPRVRYLLDATLNKLTRWLRILGQDAALETEEEERERTSGQRWAIFERCRQERRTLVTTSTRLMLRRDCPASAYCINPTYLNRLELALVHLLLTHGVVLEPSTFLSRCVVCNGSIVLVPDNQDKRRILNEYQAPPDLSDDMEVYECDGCKQGYWWNDRPTSSASRVKLAATRLFESCIRAGVPVEGNLDMFSFVDVEQERAKGWDFDKDGGAELLGQRLAVIEWLNNERLQCPLRLESAYASKDAVGRLLGESLPFTNVTFDFVNTLDYIFVDKAHFTVSYKLYVPTTFTELNRYRIERGHLLPSNVWPSDHLAVGTRLLLRKRRTGNALSTPVCLPLSGAPPTAEDSVHDQKCACGCIPKIRSLFEMAELRKQARLRTAEQQFPRA